MNKILKKSYKELVSKGFVGIPKCMLYILPLHLIAQNFDNTNQMSPIFIFIWLHIYYSKKLVNEK